jgi:hypothetical protein
MACCLSAQETALDRLKREALAARDLDRESDKDPTPAIHRALRDWIESRLPADKGWLVSERDLDTRVEIELHQADLVAPYSDAHPCDGPAFGYATVALKRLPELPDTILVTAGVSIPCGVDEAVYMYHFTAEGRQRLIEEHPEQGYGGTEIELSPPDPQGRRLLLIRRCSEECASVGGGHDVFRVSAAVRARIG